VFDKAKIEAAVISIIKAIGEDPEREGLVGTPRRIAEMYAELFMGLGKDPREELVVGFEEGHREMVIVKDIPFYSMCEKKKKIDGRVVGLSKLARVVEVVASRPQLQERMTTDIADAIFDRLKPDGVGVIIRAEHLCMIMRGIKKPGSAIVTSALRGIFRTRPETRTEFFSLIQGK